MYNISDTIQEKLAKLIEEQFGYKVQSWGTPNASGFYRPQVSYEGSVSQNIAVLRYPNTGYAFIQDHAARELESISVDLNTLKEVSREEIDAKVDKEAIKKLDTARKELFMADYKAVSEQSVPAKATDPLFKKKRLRPTSSVFTHSGNLYVPFQNLAGNIVGCQIRSPEGPKWAIKGSTTTRALHLLNPEQLDGNLLKKRILICEGYTTACEILEACPQDIIVAVAGINQLLPVYTDLKTKYPATGGIVLVLDKDKRGKETKHMVDLEAKIAKDKIEYIQPNKHDIDLADATDWNDVAHIKGKTATHREIVSQVDAVVAKLPEVIRVNEDGYEILSYLTKCVHSVPHEKPGAIRNYISEATIARFCEDANIEKDDFPKYICEWLRRQGQTASNIDCLGLGIHKDGNHYIGNFRGAKYLQNGDLRKVYGLRPQGNKAFVNISGEGDTSLDDLYESLTKEDLKELSTAFEGLYGTKAPLYVILAHIVTASYASFIKFRPHLWLLGPGGTGKSFLLDVIYNMMKGLTIKLSGSSIAGMIEKFNEGAVHSPIVLIDEAGSDSKKKASRMDEIIKTLREASTDGDAVSLRGTSEQIARAFKKKFSAVLASTTHSLEDQQDISRFFLLNIEKPVDVTKIHLFKEIEDAAVKLHPKLIKTMLFTSSHYQELVTAALEYLVKAVPVSNKDSHKRRVWAAYIAGLACLFYSFEQDKEKATEKAFKALEYYINEDRTQQEEVLESNRGIVEDIMDIELKFGSVSIPLLTHLKEIKNRKEINLKHGIRLSLSKDKKDLYLILDNKHKGYARLFVNKNKVLTPIINVEAKLKDAALLNEDIEYTTMRDTEGKNIRVYKIKVPRNTKILYKLNDLEDL